ncbi:hypothetical protein PGT21_012978 [Puccinia graminis f. sp. tritici]|uniref:Uncharacterized protein n=1 Tax=Puccinia graminis f. sp. tritici TaxID=56615 RepID=A0A5B0QA47_PUCGR|nr:hypothetical protein PGTUg99_014053 [Puccinia graminis f. sp. tritici]KAA1110166.1 hypothetical protein PGT21_012978 [Puccinia graminis f. sp. tritici]
MLTSTIHGLREWPPGYNFVSEIDFLDIFTSVGPLRQGITSTWKKSTSSDYVHGVYIGNIRGYLPGIPVFRGNLV